MSGRLHRFAVGAALALGIAVGALAPGAAQAEAKRYVIDPSHLSIAWQADHIGYGPTIGLFLKGGGEFVFDEETKTLSEAVFTVDPASVFSNHDGRDKHLKGKDFLLVSEHSEIRFVMTGAKATGDRTGVVTGDLTLRGVTRPIDVEVTWNKSGKYPFGKNYVIGVTATAMVKRSDFGMTYAVENGWVGDEVPLTISLEAIRQD